ncbi:HAD family phosphatase [Corynebacterium sp.]|uniref:HAD family hydrolase n=1 Tax=Corynebacterium sp. TaxID=1720 RepID=UPI0026DCE505|nr:HAD family phosphatase [Corynebacterium sp.]MDO5032600.1 HAD family phosphatase [Corynebacterium sp.]
MVKLLFDLYGVLMRLASAEQRAELERFLAPPDPQRFWEAYQECRPAYDAGTISDVRYWERIGAVAQLSDFDVRRAIELDTEPFLDSDPHMVTLLRELIGQGYSVGILSNIPTTLSQRVREKHTWLEDCAAVTFSCDIGVAKPELEAYRVAVDALGANPKDTLFFDDTPSYVAGAQAAGLDAHLFQGPDTVLSQL